MSRFFKRTANAEILPNSVEAKTLNDDGSAFEPAVSHDIITLPSASCKVAELPTFTESQVKLMSNLKDHLLKAHEDLEQIDKDYVPWERKWIEDPSTIRRYAMAVNWDEAQAKKRATDTLHWRRDFKPDLIVPDSVKQEGETGKHILSGFDNAGRPCLYLRPGRENTKANPQQIRFLVFDLERASDFCPPNQDKICWVIDYHRATNATQPNFSTQLKVLNILQNHYPERLGLAIVVNVPWFLSTFFTAISPFLDPVTRSKVQMLRTPEKVKDFIPVDMLDYEFGGSWKYDFQFERYWNQILDFCGIAQDGTRKHETKARSTQATSDPNGEEKDEEPKEQNEQVSNGENDTSTKEVSTQEADKPVTSD